MIRIRLPILIVCCLMFMTACESGNKQKDDFDKNEIKEDLEFLIAATKAGLTEVQLGQLAQQKGVSPKVKELGTTMVVDQTKANEELKELALKKNITLPQKLSKDDQKDLEEIAKKEGIEFDKEYLKFLIKDHEKDISKFQKEAEKGKDPQIKAFATARLPDLVQHLQSATSIQNSLQENKLQSLFPPQ